MVSQVEWEVEDLVVEDQLLAVELGVVEIVKRFVHRAVEESSLESEVVVVEMDTLLVVDVATQILETQLLAVVVVGGHEVEVEVVVERLVVVLVDQVQVLVGEVELQLVVLEVLWLEVEVDLVEVHPVEVEVAVLHLEDQVGL